MNNTVVERNNCFECIHNEVCSYKDNYLKAKENMNKYINQNILNSESGNDNSNISINIGCNKYFSSCNTKTNVSFRGGETSHTSIKSSSI